MTDRRFLFLLASGRGEGNSLSLARLAAGRIPPGMTQEWRDLTAIPLPPFEDHRHDGGYGPVEGIAVALSRATLAASDLVLVAPLYWYGLPAPAKLYLDHWSHWMRLPEMGFKAEMKGKRMWLVMAHSGATEAEIAPALHCLKFSAAYLEMVWGGALLTDANAPGDWENDLTALDLAERFFGL